MNDISPLTSSDIIAIFALITSLLTSVAFGILAYYQNKKISNLQKTYMAKENDRLLLLDAKKNIIELKREHDKYWNILFAPIQGNMNEDEINNRREAALNSARTVGKIADLYHAIKSILPEHEIMNIDSHYKKIANSPEDPAEALKIQLEFVIAFESVLDASLSEN